MRITSVLTILFLIAGCVSPEERERQQEAYERSECHKLGFEDGTEKMSECRLQVRSIQAQQRAAWGSVYGATQQNYWNTYNAATRKY